MDSVWMGWYDLLKKYKKREGDCLVRYEHVEEGRKLGGWVKQQRAALQNGSVTSGRKGLLDEIGFCWDVKESAWQENYATLKAYWESNGNCMVSKNELDDDNKLYNWILKQRNDLKKGKLTAERRGFKSMNGTAISNFWSSIRRGKVTAMFHLSTSRMGRISVNG